MLEDAALLAAAKDLMTEAHAGQKRKGSGVPYHVHPQEVGDIVSSEGPIVQAAGYLHDVIEDCKREFALQVYALHPQVAVLVEAMTRYKGMSKRLYMRRFKIFPPEAMLIKMVDRAVNLRDGRTDGVFTPQRFTYYKAHALLILEVAKEMGLHKTPYYHRLKEEVEA